MPEPLIRIDTTASANRTTEASNPPGQTERERRQSATQESRERKADLFNQIKKEKGARDVLKAMAENKTGLTPPKDSKEITHDVLLDQLREAKTGGEVRRTIIDPEGDLKNSFGTEKDEKGETVLKQEEKIRKENAVKAATKVTEYIQKGFDKLDKAEQQRIITKIKDGLSGVGIYSDILKGLPENGKEAIANILRDDELRGLIEDELGNKLNRIERNQETLASNINRAEDELKLKKSTLETCEKGINDKANEIDLTKKDLDEFGEKGGKAGSKLQEKKDIGEVDLDLIKKYGEDIKNETENIKRLDDEIRGDKADLETSKKGLESVGNSLKSDEVYLEALKENLDFDKKKIEGLTDEAEKSKVVTEITDREKRIKETEEKISKEKEEIKKREEEIQSRKEELGKKEEERISKQTEIDRKRSDKTDEEIKRDKLEALDREQRGLIDKRTGLEAKKGELEKEKLTINNEIKNAEKVLKDAVDAKAKSEGAIVGDIESVYKNEAIDYLVQKVQESRMAERQLEQKKEETDEVWKNFNDGLDNEWFKNEKRRDGWFGKKFDTSVIDKDKINADFGKLVSEGPDAIVKRILMDKCVGGDEDEADKKMLDAEFANTMRDKVIKRLLGNKLQVGQLTGSEVAKLAMNTDWGKDAIKAGIKDNKELTGIFDEMRKNGVIKGSEPAEWMNQIMKADNIDSKKKGTILGILAAIIIGTVGVGFASLGGLDKLKG